MHVSAGPAARLVALVAAAVLVAACSSDELDVDGFAPGACTDVAPAVRDLDQALRDHASDDLSGKRASAEFEVAQDALLEAVPEAEEPMAAAMTALVTDLGFLRVAVDNELEDGTPQADARTSLDDLAAACSAS